MYNQTAHTIRQGDNLYQLSRHYKTTVQAILAHNPNVDPYNLQVGATLAIPAGEEYAAPYGDRGPSACPNPAMQFSLLGRMQKAWEQHVYWTRMLIVSIAEKLRDQGDVTARLLRNPKDMADIFEGYYHADIAKTIERLLTEHLQIGAALITAMRDKKNAEVERLKRQWYANADQIAETLGDINPYYQRDELRKMLHTHLDLTIQEAARRLAGDYPAGIKAMDQVEREALAMADYWASGILRQFPQAFH